MAFDPNTAGNSEEIEKQFAVAAVHQAQTYWNLLSGARGSTIRLTKMDDEILKDFEKSFPELVGCVDKVSEDDMKSPGGKVRWRNFMMNYEKTMDDYNFGTLLRTGAKDEYGEHTTIFVPRMQFLAIEISRNRAGFNDWIYEDTHRK